jgi:hypothetical protein
LSPSPPRRAGWLRPLGVVAIGLLGACQTQLTIGGVPAPPDGPDLPGDAALPVSSDGAPDPSPDVTGADAGTCAAARPLLDVIILIDNSSSMESRMLTVLRRLSSDLPRVMTAAGVDYRVVLISRYGAYGTHLGDTYSPVCISAPLSNADCTAAARTPLANNPPLFFHFSAYVDSVNGLCRLLEVWDKPDELPAGERTWSPLMPTGIAAVLRPAAWKAILVISDDEAGCSQGSFEITEGEDPMAAARRYGRALTALSPAQFGTADSPRFSVFSLVGLTTSGAAEVLPPTAPIVTRMCDDADKVGILYQGLSIATGGARKSICQLGDLDPLFQAMARAAAPACP